MSALSEAIAFFQKFGLFDVVLPFLLVFALVFALLEKSKILGVEADGKTPKKNLNAIIAFVSALLVVAVTSVVSVIHQALPQVILFLIVIVFFLLLVGSFMKPDEGGFDFATKHPSIYAGAVIAVLLGIILIFMGAIRTETGDSWLHWTYSYAVDNWSGSIVGSIIMFVIIIAAIIWITKSNPNGGGSK